MVDDGVDSAFSVRVSTVDVWDTGGVEISSIERGFGVGYCSDSKENGTLPVPVRIESWSEFLALEPVAVVSTASL